MDSYPNPYSALIATFNQVSPESKDDLDDPQHLPDDDLLLWANAQFTYDIPPGVGIYEDDMGVKLAMSQQQFQQTQQQQQQLQQLQQQQHSQNQNGQFLQQSSSHSLVNTQQQQQQHHQQQQPQQQQQQQQPHTLQYHSSEIQRQLQQFDAIHRYLDATSEDPRSSLSVVERSRQRNPAGSGDQPQQQQAHQSTGVQQYDHHLSSAYPPSSSQGSSSASSEAAADSHLYKSTFQDSSAVFSTPTTAGPISPAAARLLRQQPSLVLQHHQQQQHASLQNHSFSVSSSPLPSPTTMSDFRQLQINPQPLTTVIGPQNSSSAPLSKVLNADAAQRVNARQDNISSAPSPANSTSSIKANASSSPSHALPQREEKVHEAELDEYDLDQEEHGGSGLSSKGIEGLSQDDPEYAQKFAAEEDKRRRNTAASARFRHKKRLREQILEKTAKEMTAKSELLEVRVRELEMEIKWLRGLIVEKDSRMLESLPVVSAASSTAGVSSPSSSSAGSSGASLSSSLPTISSLSSLRGSTKSENTTAAKRRSKKAQQV